MIGATHKSNSGNCCMQDDTSVVILSPVTKKATSFIDETYDLENIDEWTDIYLSSIGDNSYKLNVLIYISGFIQRKLKAKEQCVFCCTELENGLEETTCGFLEFKTKGGLTRPSKGFVNVVEIANSQLEYFMKVMDIYTTKGIIDRIFLRTVDILKSKYPTTFSNFDNHVDTCSVTTSHRFQLIKKIVSCFITMRLKHLCKERNEHSGVKIRRKLSRIILFKNQ